MKQATRRSPNQKPLTVHVTHRIREGLLILTIGISLFLLLALVTYHVSDPGWSDTGQSQQIANAGGKVGAWVSDIFLYIFGYMAYIFPLMLSYAAWLNFSQRIQEEEHLRYWFLSLRIA